MKKNVVIIFGGKSLEHDISLLSAKNLFDQIDKQKYCPILIGISKEGKWFFKETVDNNFDDQKQIKLLLSSSKKSFYVIQTKEIIVPDIIFPMMHGTDGEDGAIQGFCQFLDIPYVGSGILGSCLAMDKLYTKKMLESANIPVCKYLSMRECDEIFPTYEEIVKELGIPFMLKATNLGSSIGIWKINEKSEYLTALEQVFNYSKVILIESFVKGRELECSVIGNHVLEVSLPAEIRVSENCAFYDYNAKYNNDKDVQLIVSADLDFDTVSRIQTLSKQSYQILGCEDMARVDVFLSDQGQIFVNEINTIPGLTNKSMFPMMWKERGIDFTSLISKIIESAFTKHSHKKKDIINQLDKKDEYK